MAQHTHRRRSGSDERRLRRTVAIVAEIAGLAMVTVTVYFVVPLDGEYAELFAGALVVVAIVGLVPLAIRRARQVLTSEQPLLVAAQSLAIAATLLVVSFASVYFVLGSAHDGQIDGIATKIDGLYFAITILSTVGFGDITADGQAARAVVAAHMIVNLVFLALAIRVVSWALEQRRGSGSSRPAAPSPAASSPAATSPAASSPAATSEGPA